MYKPVRFDKPDTGMGGGGNADPSSTPSQGSVPGGTPSQSVSDAGQQELQRLQELLAQRERDVNNVKSTLQRQLSQQQRQWEEERQQMQEELRKVQMASLDDDERAEYQRNLQLEQAGQWQKRAQELEQKLQEREAIESYTQFFIEQGVPTGQLVRDQGVDALVQSGWTGVQAIIKDLQAKVNATPQQQQPVPPQSPEAQTRPPISAAQAPAGTGPTWNDLIQRYGSSEEVYRLVEQGDLPPSIIPTA